MARSLKPRSKPPRNWIVQGSCVALVAGFILSSQHASAQSVQFTVSDSLSTGQVQEDISVFLGGRFVGSLHIDLSHPHDEVSVSAMSAEHYDFALCGRLVRDSGEPPEHRIDDAGTLADVAGRTFAAITVKDTLFTLQDVTEDRAHVAVLARPGPACAPAVASR